MRTEEGTFEKACERARKAVESDFAEHVITAEGPGRWHCGKPDSGISSFRVITSPGAVIVHGDIGDAIFSVNERDTLPWLISVGKHREFYYAAEKMGMGAGLQRTFYQGDAMAYLEERLKQDLEYDAEHGAEDESAEERRETVARKAEDDIRSAFDFDELDYHKWCEAWRDAGEDEIRECLSPSFRNMVILEALTWFAAHVEVPS